MIARVKHGGVWVTFNGGSFRVKGRKSPTDPVWIFAGFEEAYLKHNGSWLPLFLPWG